MSKIYLEENAEYIERFELVRERIAEIKTEASGEYKDYFVYVAGLIEESCKVYELVESGELYKLTLEELKAINDKIFDNIRNYETCFGNPDYLATLAEGDDVKYASLLAMIYSYMFRGVDAAFAGRLRDLTTSMELFSYVYCEMSQEGNYESVYDAIYWHISDYCDVNYEQAMRENFDPAASRGADIIRENDLNDLRYLYFYGVNVTENEIGTAKYLNTLSDDEVAAIARTYTEGYRKGFITMGVDLSKKALVDVRYSLGFERVVKAAMAQFEEMGLKSILRRIGYSSTPASRQYNYDHRFDMEFFLDKALIERRIDTAKAALELYKEGAYKMAGPAVIETFGEKPFEPATAKYALKLDSEKEKLYSEFRSRYVQLYNEYVKGDETSFTIIAYPVPEIGDNYEELFAKTMEINNLDSDLWAKIQATIIDALDESEYVKVVGTNGNTTDITVQLYKLNNPEKETKFENCVADVNIPVGEVFTSPVLKGTSGVLNVSSVYLNDLKFVNLKVTFTDGMITDYTCDNFDNEEDNKKFIKENLLVNRETLPIGEFAIGTNTTAYVIANQYDIVYKLPILIVEKMGPHFAVGDTCYKHAEEVKVYNPNGKEIVARDNEISILRKESPKDAYFNTHTDITIPYDEIGEIYGVDKNGEKISIIKDGRFVLKGCEELNKPFEKR